MAICNEYIMDVKTKQVSTRTFERTDIVDAAPEGGEIDFKQAAKAIKHLEDTGAITKKVAP